MKDKVLLSMEHICKSFPGVTALDDVQLHVDYGEIHALVGENGAGKSTLIKILTGIYAKDGGEIEFDGKPFEPKTAIDAQRLGISTIYQELNMIPYLSVAENICLGRYQKHGIAIDRKEMYQRAAKLMEQLGVDVDVTVPINTLGAATQQMVAIARALNCNVKLLVMDEPTSSLDTYEVEKLFATVRRLQSQGISAIFITHRMDEIFQLTSRITVLKDGKFVGMYPTSSLTKLELVELMIGSSKKSIGRRDGTRKISNEYMLQVKNLSCWPKLRNISFGVRRGEILGLAGLLGAGRTETARVIFGCDSLQGGSMTFEGKPFAPKDTQDAIRAGLAFVTENRREEGIIPNMSVKENTTLTTLKALSSFGFLNEKKQRKIAEDYVQKLRVKTPGVEQKIKNLSGGNQQKVLIARWLCNNPKLVIFDEPTRGIDVGAKAEIEELIREFANNGISVLLISSELTELVHNCDRVVVIHDGNTVGELEGKNVSEEAIIRVIASADIDRTETPPSAKGAEQT